MCRGMNTFPGGCAEQPLEINDIHDYYYYSYDSITLLNIFLQIFNSTLAHATDKL